MAVPGRPLSIEVTQKGKAARLSATALNPMPTASEIPTIVVSRLPISQFLRMLMPERMMTPKVISATPPSTALGTRVKTAQIFGQMGGNLLGGGEAGQEAVLPLSDFYGHLDGILSRYMNNTASGLVIQLNIERFENGGSEDIKEIARRVGIEVRREVEKKRGAFE